MATDNTLQSIKALSNWTVYAAVIDHPPHLHDLQSILTSMSDMTPVNTTAHRRLDTSPLSDSNNLLCHTWSVC